MMVWEDSGVAQRKAITSAINGAEFLELAFGTKEGNLTVPARVRTLCGLEPWSLRGREMQDRSHALADRRVMALDRISVTIMVTEAEWDKLRDEAREGEGTTLYGETVHGLSLPQYVRTRCGFKVRWTSRPNTGDRDREVDDAWERLERLGLKPQDYFPEYGPPRLNGSPGTLE